MDASAIRPMGHVQGTVWPSCLPCLLVAGKPWARTAAHLEGPWHDGAVRTRSR